MALYVFRCGRHGEVEVRRSMTHAGDPAYCEECVKEASAQWDGTLRVGSLAPFLMQRVYTPPVTDCHSFGKNQYGARTPEHLRRPRSEDQARAFRDAARETGARTQFGPGRTTGS
jgi:hypothetical protein